MVNKRIYKPRIFEVGQFNVVIQTCTRLTPVAMVTKMWVFERKIDYNPASIGDKYQIFVSNWVYAFTVSWCHS